MDLDALDELRSEIRQQVDSGRMPAVQFAFAYDGELVTFESYGDATNATRFTVFSATKAVVAGAVWQLLAEGAFTLDTKVIEILPDFGQRGATPEWMASVTLEHLLTHVSGFPYAALSHPRWASRQDRLERYSTWEAATEPGTVFTYHPLNAHWVIADMIETLEKADYREVIRGRVIDPVGMTDFSLGLPADQQNDPAGRHDNPAGRHDDIAELRLVGERPSPEQVRKVLGDDVDLTLLDQVAPDLLLGFNLPELREVGLPGGGGIGTAADLAMYYQALLHNIGGLWDPAILADATGTIRCTLPDPMLGIPSNRSLGLIIAGDDGLAKFRSMGPTVGPRTFGHNGAAGQIVWGDPDSGLSFTLLTSAVELNFLDEARRILTLTSLAGNCK